jgi:hypothetical protein
MWAQIQRILSSWLPVLQEWYSKTCHFVQSMLSAVQFDGYREVQLQVVSCLVGVAITILFQRLGPVGQPLMNFIIKMIQTVVSFLLSFIIKILQTLVTCLRTIAILAVFILHVALSSSKMMVNLIFINTSKLLTVLTVPVPQGTLAVFKMVTGVLFKTIVLVIQFTTLTIKEIFRNVRLVA